MLCKDRDAAELPGGATEGSGAFGEGAIATELRCEALSEHQPLQLLWYSYHLILAVDVLLILFLLLDLTFVVNVITPEVFPDLFGCWPDIVLGNLTSFVY